MDFFKLDNLNKNIKNIINNKQNSSKIKNISFKNKYKNKDSIIKYDSNIQISNVTINDEDKSPRYQI